jgi:hypothetical protein
MSNGSAIGASNQELGANAQIAAKEEAVERAGAAFSTSMEDASAAGRGSLKRAVSATRPVLIGAAVLAVGGLAIAAFRRAPSKRASRARSSGPWSDLARAAAVAFAAAAGRRLVEHWLRSDRGRASGARTVQRALPEASRST